MLAQAKQLNRSYGSIRSVLARQYMTLIRSAKINYKIFCIKDLYRMSQKNNVMWYPNVSQRHAPIIINVINAPATIAGGCDRQSQECQSKSMKPLQIRSLMTNPFPGFFITYVKIRLYLNPDSACSLQDKSTRPINDLPQCPHLLPLALQLTFDRICKVGTNRHDIPNP